MTAAAATTLRAPADMVERKGTKLYQWEYRTGEVLEGMLVRRGLEKFTVDDPEGKHTPPRKIEKQAIGLTLVMEDGAKVKTLAPYDLADKVEVGDIGHWVIIRYTGDESIGGNRKMKRFDVRVSREKVRDVAALQITDEDLPF